MGGQNQDPTAHGTLWNLTLGEPVARAQLLQQQVANAQLNQAATRAGLFQDPASRAALFANPRMLQLMHLQASQVPLGGATMQQFPQLSPGDQPLLSHITQVPTNLPAMVMTPERAQMLRTLGQAGGQDQTQLLQQLQQMGFQPQSARVGNVTYGLPTQQPGDQPLWGGGQGGAAQAPTAGGAPALGAPPRLIGPQTAQAPRVLGGNRADLNSPFFRQVESQYGIPAGVLSGLAEQESGGRIDAANPQSSARGLYQFIHSTAQQAGIDPFDPVQSTIATAKMLRQNYDRTGSWEQAIGAHYGGPGAAFAQKVGPSGLSPQQYATQVVRRIGKYAGAGGEQGGGGYVQPANYDPSQIPASPPGMDPAAWEQSFRNLPPGTRVNPNVPAEQGGAITEGWGLPGALQGRVVPATYQVPADGAPQGQQVGYPSPAFQDQGVAPGAMELAPPTPLPGSQIAQPPPAAGGPPPQAQVGMPQAPPPGAPPAGGAPPTAPGGMPQARPRGPGPITQSDLHDLQQARANVPGLDQYLQSKGYTTEGQALQDPEVTRQIDAWKQGSAFQKQATGREIQHQQEAPWEQQKTAQEHGWQLETEGRQAEAKKQAEADKAAQQALPEIDARRFDNYTATRQAVRSFDPQDIEKYSGVTTGITNIWNQDPGYDAHQTKIAQLNSSILATAQNAADRDALQKMLPTGRENAAQFTAKLRQIDDYAAKRSDGLLKSHKVGDEARKQLYATDFAPLDDVFGKGARTIGPVPAEPPRQLAPAQPAPPEAAPAAAALPPGTSVTTTPTTTGGQGVPAPAPAAPPAAAPPPGAPAPAPQGGVSAAEIAAGGRPQDISFAEKLALAPMSAGETQAQTQARRAENVKRQAQGLPPIPRTPAEMVAGPNEFGTRLLRTVAQASQPQYVGQTAKAALAATGAPGAAAGSIAEGLSGSRGVGTAVQTATDLAPLAGPAARTIGRLAAPSLAAPELGTLSREAVPDLTARLGAKAAAALQPGAGGMVLKPVVAAQVGQVQDALKAATAATDAATQAEHLARAAKLIAKVPGSSPDDVAALTTLSKQMSQQVRTVQRYQAAGKVAGRVVGAGTVYHLAKKAMGPIGDYFTGGDQGGQ